MSDSYKLAKRMQDIAPFHVMAILARARELEAQGRSIVHMEIGEPDFVSPAPVIEAGVQALKEGKTHYTPALGLPALRQAISQHYQQHYGLDVPAARIAITPGASGALQLILNALIDPGDEVLMADPGYPCNRNFVSINGGNTILVPVDASSAYQLTAQHLQQHWTEHCVATMLASPSNPTGTLVDATSLQSMFTFVQSKGAALIVDELYHGLIYTQPPMTALAISDELFVINSFSKFFGMTGWRVGWMVVPEAYIDAVDRLAQNVYLAASTPAQYAALAAFGDDTQQILCQRRDEFKRRRDYLITALREIGFAIPVTPEGAFYLYANCEKFTSDSEAFARQLLEQAGVAITPGIDFGHYGAAQHVRFAYTTGLEQLEEGVQRIKQFLA